MDKTLENLKPVVRAILLSLGRSTTEHEFLREYAKFEGEPFAIVLRKYNLSFCDFMKKLPDCCDVQNVGGLNIIQRISNEKTSHLDSLRIRKKPYRR